MTAHVKFGKISRIQIDTHMRQVDNGAKVHLKAVGICPEGNRMSTMNGLRFDWQVETGHGNVRMLKDEHHLQAHGYTSDDLVIKTLRTGVTSLSVRILEPGYEDVAPASIKLTIVDPFVIEFADSFVEDGRSDWSVLPVSALNLQTFIELKREDQALDFREIATTYYEWAVDSEHAAVSNRGVFHSYD